MFTYPSGQDWLSFHFPSFTPFYNVNFSNSALEQKANEICGDDKFCLFDIAATRRVEVGEATFSGGQVFEMLINMSQPSKLHVIMIYTSIN